MGSPLKTVSVFKCYALQAVKKAALKCILRIIGYGATCPSIPLAVLSYTYGEEWALRERVASAKLPWDDHETAWLRGTLQ